MYTIEFTIAATKEYFKLPSYLRQKVDFKLNVLAKNPYAQNNNIKPMLGNRGCYRLRIGIMRIIYEIMSCEKKIIVIKIGQRKEVYRQ
jgi:mRNA interferase RelE/StbE